MSCIVSLRDLDFIWPGAAQPVLKNISWTIEEGARCALTGENGSGKSSLLGLLAGHLWPARGEIFWHGNAGPEYSRIYGRSVSALVSPKIQEQIQRQSLSATFLDALLGAFDDSPYSYSAMYGTNEQARVARETARELACADLLAKPLQALSQGEMRILLCARALLRKPRLCLLDEAFDGLDNKRRAAFFAALDRLSPACAIIIATHREDALPSFCTERRHLAQGKLTDKRIDKRGEKRTEKISGPRTAFPASPSGAAQGAPDANPLLLNLQNASVYVDRTQVLRNITWQTRPGEHWRISGENGSGKSTLLRLLAGLEQVSCEGAIERALPHIHGPAPAFGEIRAQIRLVSDAEQAQYGYDLTGFELVLSGHEQSIGLYREYSAAEKRAAEAALRRFFGEKEAAHIMAASIRKLSTGQLRRLYLARAMLGDPAILLLDEAASGLDAASRQDWFNALENASRRAQIIMVSHRAEDIPAFINREARMKNGRLEVVGQP